MRTEGREEVDYIGRRGNRRTLTQSTDIEMTKRADI